MSERKFRVEPQPEIVNVSGKTLAAGEIEANVRNAIPAASALPLTIDLISPSQPRASGRLILLPLSRVNAIVRR